MQRFGVAFIALSTSALCLACSEDSSGTSNDGDAVQTPEPSADDGMGPDPTPEPADDAPEPADDAPEPGAGDPEPAAQPEPDSEPNPMVEPQADAEPSDEPEPEAEVEPEPEPSADAGTDPGSPEPEPEPEELVGVCGNRGEATVTLDDTFEGYEEFYIIGDEGFGLDVCVVRFEVNRIGDAPEGCMDLDGEPCGWTHLVEYTNPTVELDEDGVCAGSELGFDEAGIEAIVGTQTAYGFVFEYAGHNSVLLKYDDASGMWIPNGNATWDEETNGFRFDRRDGICNY